MAAPRKEDIAELIISTTKDLLKEKTLSEISLSEIANTAGIAKGTLYYHFKTKDDIMFAVMDDYLEEQRQNLLDWTSDKSKDTSLHRLIKYVLERDTSTADMRLHFFYDALSGNEVIREKLLSRYHEFSVIIAEKIAERTDGISSEYLSWLILLLSDGLLMHKMLRNPDVDTEGFIKQSDKYFQNIYSSLQKNIKR